MQATCIRPRYLAGGLVVLTILMGVGIFGVATFMWQPLLEAMK